MRGPALQSGTKTTKALGHIMCAAGRRPSIMGKIFLKRSRSNNYENFAYGILVRDSGLAGGWRPDDYTTLPRLSSSNFAQKKSALFCADYLILSMEINQISVIFLCSFC